jgi:anti-sigma factor RsiW
MSCAQHRQEIHDLVDGTLGGIRRAELQKHLNGCDACRAYAADMQRLRELAGSLDRLSPPDGVWLQVAGRLRQEGRVQPSAPVRRPAPPRRYAWVAIAAALVITVGASLMVVFPILRSSRAGTAVAPAPAAAETAADRVTSVEDDFRLAEQHLQSGIAKLEEAAKTDDAAIDPQTAATLKKNLEVIDQAIAESRAALNSEPQSTIARDSLFQALRRKVDLLQETIALMNEMRKGDAAGAGRIVDSLNKS